MASSARRNEKPHPIAITKHEGNKNIVIDMNAVTEIFRREEIQDMPIAIVGISGAFRSGKSFMLNFFLRYLKSEGYQNWMGNLDEVLDYGFDWNSEMDACTIGILIWSEIFFTVKDGKKVAVMLMDSQGLFDYKADNETNSIIFALSTLISSVQIFNLTTQIQQNDLGFLQFFTGYAKAAQDSPSTRVVKPFQTLVFLVRDWPYAHNVNFGKDSEDKYLEKVLHTKTSSKELNSVKKYLNSSFGVINCWLMPYPGEKVAEQQFSGYLKDIKPDFLQCTSNFVEELFKPENIVVKAINGKVVTAVTILQYITNCGKSMANGNLPKPGTMFETVAESQNFQAKKDCLEIYTESMKKVVGDDYYEQSLDGSHKSAKSKALEQYQDKTKFGGNDIRQKYRDILEEDIGQEYERILQLNECKKGKLEVELYEAIHSIEKAYLKSMNQAIKDKQFVEEKHLETDHQCYAKTAENAWGNVKAPHSLKIIYHEKLMKSINMEFGTLRDENKKNREIAESSGKEREAKTKALEREKLFWKDLQKKIKTHVDEEDMDIYGEDLKTEHLYCFKIDLLRLEIDKHSLKYTGHVDALETELDKVLEKAKTNNKDEKEKLEKKLKVQRSTVTSDYDTKFDKLLKDNYMEEGVLTTKHNEVVKDLMNDLKQQLGSDLSDHDPVVIKHMILAKNSLQNKLPDIKAKNKKNKSSCIVM